MCLKSEVVDDVHAKVGLLEKRLLTGKFPQMFYERIHGDIDPRVVCKFREIWLTGNRQSRALLTRQKKTKFRLALPLSLLRGSRPKSVRVSSRQYTRSVPSPNPFTSGGVIAERVNIVQTRHKVFPILGEATVSSPSNNLVALCHAQIDKITVS